VHYVTRSRSRIKALFWDGSGLWVCATRLEKGRFRWPGSVDGVSIRMQPEELAMLLGGLDLDRAKRRRGWYRREPAA